MSSMVAAVKDQVDEGCLQEDNKKLSAKNCSLYLAGSPGPRLVIHFDKSGSPLGESDTKPDFLFLSDKGGKDKKGQDGLGLLVPIELSAGRSKSALKIKDQLQAGVDWSDTAIPEQCQLQLLPIYCGAIDNFEKSQINKASFRIKFRGSKESVLLRQCGSKLTEALEASTG